LDCNIEYDPKSLKQLQKLNKQEAVKILDGIDQYANDPIKTKTKKLKTSFEGAYRLRSTVKSKYEYIKINYDIL